MRLVVVLLDLARAGVLRVVRVVVWRRQALGRVGVMLLGECGQQAGWANKLMLQQADSAGGDAGTNKQRDEGQVAR